MALRQLLLLAISFLMIQKTAFAQSEKIYPHKKDIYHKGWIDFNKNGKKDVYEDTTQPIEKRIQDLLGQMTLEEKSCQLATYYGHGKVLKDSLPTAAWKDMIFKDGIANIDEHINNTPKIKENETPYNNALALAETQRFFVEYTRLGIPVDFTNEGIRGLCARHATSFPSMNGLGCTWDKNLAQLQGEIQGKEARALGYTNVYAPILDVARDQRWGRWEGTLGEDPYLVARMGVAMAKGIQSQRVVSTPKHFVGYGDCKAARQWDARTDPHITPSEMYYIHEYPFRKVFQEAGALGVMCAYNDYNGVPMAANYDYLTNKLRGEMGFKGYVVSDSYSIERLSDIHKVCADHKESCLLALKAGLNVRTEFNEPNEYINNIRALVKEGRLPIERVDELVSQVLYVKFWEGLFDQPYSGDPKLAQKIVSSPEHLQASLHASRECLVLLKNDSHILPFKSSYKKIAVIGPNANTNNYVPTHYGPMDYKFVSVFDGLKNVYQGKDVEVKYAKGINLINKGWPESELIPDTLTVAEKKDINEAVELAKQSDVAVLVLGDGTATSGESRTRSSLDLPGHQQQLLEAVVSTGKPVVLVLIWGRPATINYAQKYAKAILSAGYPGAQGGQAIAEALEGLYNPGGKLNGTWPKTVGQLPFNIPTKPNANFEELKYYTVANKGLLYCFGYGLSYTTFKYDSLQIDSLKTKTATVNISCNVTNTGDVEGDEVVQLYINDVISSTTTYEKNLRGFERVHLKPSETKKVSFRIVPDDLILINAQNERVVEPGEFRVMIGASYDDIRLKDSFYVIDGSGLIQINKSQQEVKKSVMMRDTDAVK
jgi:Beta-glucosidase-related glycosidases